MNLSPRSSMGDLVGTWTIIFGLVCLGPHESGSKALLCPPLFQYPCNTTVLQTAGISDSSNGLFFRFSSGSIHDQYHCERPYRLPRNNRIHRQLHFVTKLCEISRQVIRSRPDAPHFLNHYANAISLEISHSSPEIWGVLVSHQQLA